MGAFAKMEKKFDKVFNKEYRQLTTFFRTVERSYFICSEKAKQGGDHDEPEPQFEREREPQPKENETVENVVAAQVAQQAESEIVEESPQVAQQAESEIVEERPQVAQQAEIEIREERPLVAQQAESEIVEERPQVAQQAEEEEEEEDEGNFLFKLNGELEKVNQFYTSKEEEYLRRGELLDNQLQALLSMRREQFQATRGQRQPMRIHIPAATPWQTITSIASRLRGFLVHNPGTEDEGINYNQLQEAEDMIRKTYIDLYTGLNLLKTYSTQNMGAFAKMEKKFDKVFNKEYRQLTTFFKTVEISYFICSEKVVRLMDDIESSFTKNFAKNDKKLAMKFLKPKRREDPRSITYCSGFSMAAFIFSFAIFALVQFYSMRQDPDYYKENGKRVFDNIFPIFSVVILSCLHILMYGCNLLWWKVTGVNHAFFFGLQPTTILNHRDAFLTSTSMMAFMGVAMIAHLILYDSDINDAVFNKIFPGVYLLISIGLLVWPCKLFYGSSRYRFLKVIWYIVCAPLYKMNLGHTFPCSAVSIHVLGTSNSSTPTKKEFTS